MTNSEQTTADKALNATKAKQEPVAKEEAPKKKYLPGVYRSDKYMRIIKKLSYEIVKDAAGQVQKTYGTWAVPDNFIIFQKDVEKRLTAEDLKLPAIQNLIDSRVIYRVGD